MTSPTLNCDLGEWESADHRAALMQHLHWANIACGGHAGSPETIDHALVLAARHDVRAGAHPGLDGARSLADLQAQPSSARDAIAAIREQIVTFEARCLAAHLPFHHIKLHGALYHAAEHDAAFCSAVFDLYHDVLPADTIVVGIAGGQMVRAAKARRFPVAEEAFLDRNYLSNGALVPREDPRAMLTDPDDLRQRLERLLQNGELVTVDGSIREMTPDTLCIHSDSDDALAAVRLARELLNESK